MSYGRSFGCQSGNTGSSLEPVSEPRRVRPPPPTRSQRSSDDQSAPSWSAAADLDVDSGSASGSPYRPEPEVAISTTAATVHSLPQARGADLPCPPEPSRFRRRRPWNNGLHYKFPTVIQAIGSSASRSAPHSFLQPAACVLSICLPFFDFGHIWKSPRKACLNLFQIASSICSSAAITSMLAGIEADPQPTTTDHGLRNKHAGPEQAPPSHCGIPPAHAASEIRARQWTGGPQETLEQPACPDHAHEPETPRASALVVGKAAR